MKKIVLLTLFISQLLLAQEEEQKESDFSFNHQFFFYLNHHNNFGDNFLSEANQPDFAGFGTQYNFIKYYGFKLGVGYEFMGYEVTDEALAGNINRTNYSCFFSKIQYEHKLNSDWSAEPYVGIGQVIIHQKTGSRSFGKFYGVNYNLGANVVYNVSKHFGAFGGVNYSYTDYDVETADEYQDFFEKSNQIQMALGVIFTIN